MLFTDSARAERGSFLTTGWFFGRRQHHHRPRTDTHQPNPTGPRRPAEPIGAAETAPDPTLPKWTAASPYQLLNLKRHLETEGNGDRLCVTLLGCNHTRTKSGRDIVGTFTMQVIDITDRAADAELGPHWMVEYLVPGKPGVRRRMVAKSTANAALLQRFADRMPYQNETTPVAVSPSV